MHFEVSAYRPRHKTFCSKNSKFREFLTWVHLINGLDPFIHRAIYQYWKATALYWNFCEEAVTALDGVTSIAGEFLQQRFGVQGNPRQSLMTTLQLSAEDQRLIDHLYNLRCDFGAHPISSKWWDVAEIYDEDIDAIRDSVKRMLLRLCQIENLNRVVEPFPEKWSYWFRQNALLVYNTVWFTKIRYRPGSR